MKYFGIDAEYLLQPESGTSLPSWDSKYERSFFYAEDVETMYYGTSTGWVACSANVAAGYIYTQSVASATWSVTHNLDQQNVCVTVYGSDNKAIMPEDIETVDANSLTITFTEAVTGVAVIVAGNPGSTGYNGLNTLAGTSLVDHQYQGSTIQGAAGEAISRGNLCYCKLNSSAWKYYKYDANGTDKLILPTVIATEDIAQGSSGTFLKNGGTMRDDTWSLSGTADSSTTVYASGTAGGLTMTAPTTSGDEVIVVGFLIAANVIDISIGYTWVEVK